MIEERQMATDPWYVLITAATGALCNGGERISPAVDVGDCTWTQVQVSRKGQTPLLSRSRRAPDSSP